jgi:phage/plasmid primase-like uncharacterized protein
MERINEFCESMAAHCLRCPDDIVPDGKIHRFHVDGDKPSSINGWYCLFSDNGTGSTAVYGSWKLGTQYIWSSGNARVANEKQREQIKRAIETAAKEREDLQKKVRDKALIIWNSAHPASKDHAYLQAKKIKDYSIKQIGKSLIIPVYGHDQKIHSLQFINESGQKLFLKNGAIKSNFFSIKGVEETILLCEGYATGASLFEATGYTTIVSFNCHNLKPVAINLKSLFPDSKILICADDDFRTEGNPGQTEAEKTANEIGWLWVFPKFKDSDNRGTDFNDLCQIEGSDVVRTQIQNALQANSSLPKHSTQLSEKIKEEATLYNYKSFIKEISKLEDLIEKEILCKELAKKLGIYATTIKNAVTPKDSSAKSISEQYCARFTNLIDLVDIDGKTAFLFSENGMFRSESSIELEGITHTPPPKVKITFTLPRYAEVQRHFQEDENRLLFGDVLAYYKQASELPDERYYVLLTVWTFHTYLLEKTNFSPEIVLFSTLPEKGKSRTGKAMIYLAYRGEVIETVRESYIFRNAQNFGGSLFFDCMDLWRKVEKNQSEDIFLNRYEKGCRVPRVLYPEKGPFKDTEYYDIFGPTVIATNVSVHKILETRAIQIIMKKTFRKFSHNITPCVALPLKERLTAFRARQLESELPDMEKPFNGRFGDITKPLLQIARLVSPEYENDLVSLFEEMLKQNMESKQDSSEYKIIKTLLDLEEEAEQGFLSTERITEKLNEDIPEKWKVGSRSIGRKLKGLAFRSGKDPTGTRRGIKLDCQNILRLLSEYDEKAMYGYVQQKCPKCPKRQNCNIFNELQVGRFTDVISKHPKNVSDISNRNSEENDVSDVSDVSANGTREVFII